MGASDNDIDFRRHHTSKQMLKGTSRNSLSTTSLRLFGVSKFGLGIFFLARREIYFFAACIVILLPFFGLLAMIHRCNSVVY